MPRLLVRLFLFSVIEVTSRPSFYSHQTGEVELLVFLRHVSLKLLDGVFWRE